MTDFHADVKAGRAACGRRAWTEAFDSLSRADRTHALDPPDLELLATSAYLIGHEDAFLRALERAHDAYRAGNPVRAARCGFWIGMSLADRGEIGQATGWFGCANRLLARDGRECAERGYLLLPVSRQQLIAGAYDSAYDTAARAVAIGERFRDADLTTFALHVQGLVRLRQSRVEEGLALLDEAMVAVASGRLSPVVTGILYCSVIGACRSVYALRRAHEWTAALADWCAQQPDMVAYNGECLVYRAEIMQLHGAWRSSIEEAVRARMRFNRATEARGAAAAHYQQGVVHRLMGSYAQAETAYRDAAALGYEPQPGLALLRVAQGNTAAAAAAIRRALGESRDPLKRARLLPASVEIELATGDTAAARRAALELAQIARTLGADVLDAMVAMATGAVALAEGDATAALVALRRARHGWQSLEAPYEAGRVRVLIGLACRALGDTDTAALELETARAVFEQLGATPDLDHVDSLIGATANAHGLTPREVVVLGRLVTGRTNRAIAAELYISEKTVARHVSNIFRKLGVSSRAAATAYAYEHDLV